VETGLPGKSLADVWRKYKQYPMNAVSFREPPEAVKHFAPFTGCSRAGARALSSADAVRVFERWLLMFERA
jgi:hypothetical protein